MFDRLSERFDHLFRSLRGQGRITERNIDDTLRQIRRSLLEADVNFKVAKDFIQRVKEQALGQNVLKSLTPGQQLVKIVHRELVALLGGSHSPPNLAAHPPTVVMLVGLQGCGKTTMAAKLARQFKERGRPPLLIAVDVYRPAAIAQLQSLGTAIDVPVFSQPTGTDPVAICRRGIDQARQTHRSIALIDTAGRLSIDENMMDELDRIRQAIEPLYGTLFVDGDFRMQGVVKAHLGEGAAVAGDADVGRDNPVVGLFAFAYSLQAKFDQCCSPWMPSPQGAFSFWRGRLWRGPSV